MTAFSASAKAKIEKVGGAVEITLREVKPVIRHKNKKAKKA